MFFIIKIRKFILFAFIAIFSFLYPYSMVNAAPVMVSPIDGSTLTQTTETFTWHANGTAGITQWWIYLGTNGVGSTDVFSGSLGLDTTATYSGLPNDGSTIYLRLWYRTTSWQLVDFTFTSCAGCTPSLPAVSMYFPVDGSTFQETYQLFKWQQTNLNVLEWWLYLGTTPGSANLYNSTQGLSTEVTVSGLPTNGGSIYARLWYRTNAGWSLKDYSYIACSGVCANLPHFNIKKTSALISDGLNGVNPKHIPDSIVEYTITVENFGLGTADANSIIIKDSIPPQTEFVNGTLVFLTNTSGLNPVATLSEIGGDIQVTPQGIFLASGGGANPSFYVKFRVKVK